MDNKTLEKISRYCAIQERSKYDVINKLKSYKVDQDELQSYIDYLQKNNFLNEERFVELYIRSKINQNEWGPLKIKYSLYQKNIPEAEIDRFLDKYDKEFFKLKIKEYLKKHKVEISNLSYEEKIYWAKHLQQKGYDIEIINELIFS
ncbi:MAG TPA: regulatory protein RecX [Bacteroidales bacterium]|nr:regulatory protein RecX [Bacteroidales bacterium]